MAISNTHNLMTANAGKTFSINNTAETQSAEKLSSEPKVNQEADIAASLKISERMRRQFSGTSRSIQAEQEDTGLDRVADGALAKVSEMLHQVTELSIKAVGGSGSGSDRQAIQQEIHQLMRDIDQIRNLTQANKQSIYKGVDADRAGAEMVKNATGSILQQPAQSMAAQANQEPGFVIQLLQ